MRGERTGLTYDLLVREAFFGRSIAISNPKELLRVVGEAGLDTRRFERDLVDGTARGRVPAE